MKHNIQAYIYKGEEYYVAKCVEISIVTQGKTLDETIANLQEAVNLHLEGENPAEFGLVENPKLIVIMDLGEVNEKRESLNQCIASERRWQSIRKRGEKTAKAFDIRNEEDVDRLIHSFRREKSEYIK